MVKYNYFFGYIEYPIDITQKADYNTTNENVLTSAVGFTERSIYDEFDFYA